MSKITIPLNHWTAPILQEFAEAGFLLKKFQSEVEAATPEQRELLLRGFDVGQIVGEAVARGELAPTVSAHGRIADPKQKKDAERKAAKASKITAAKAALRCLTPEQKRYSQAEKYRIIAEQLGVSPRTVRAYLSGG